MPPSGTTPFLYLVRNLYSRRLKLDDGVSGAFTGKKNRRDRRKNNEITASNRLISGSSSCGTSRKDAMSLVFENFFSFTRTIENRVKSGLYVSLTSGLEIPQGMYASLGSVLYLFSPSSSSPLSSDAALVTTRASVPPQK